MSQDVADWTQAVIVNGGSVSISGTAVVSIAGTPAVTISGTATVQIAGVPSVTIASGSVTINNASIGVINAAGTKITSARPPQLLQQIFQLAGGTSITTTAALPSDIQALLVVLANPLVSYAHLKVEWHTGAGMTWVPLELFQFTQNIYVVPILPSVHDNSAGLLNTLDVTVQAAAGGAAATVELVALFEPDPLWLEYFQPPFAEPNQSPLVAGQLAQANNTAQWLIAPVAGHGINVFEITTLYISGIVGTGSYVVGHGTVLPVAVPPAASQLFISGNTGAFAYEFHGAALPAGEGIYLWNQGGGVLGNWHLINYSLR